jgi:hypothetical protein
MTMRPPGFVTRTISFATSNGLGANIAPKLLQVRRVAFLEPDVGQIVFLRTPVAGFDEISRDIYAEDVGAACSFGQGRRAIAASEIQDLESLRHADSLDRRVSALAHRVGDAREVSLFPQGLVRVGWCIHRHGCVPYLRT